MTISELVESINAIKDADGDFERQHSLEDKLYYKFIQFVAEIDVTNEIAVSLLTTKARLLLTTKEIKFERWCA